MTLYVEFTIVVTTFFVVACLAVSLRTWTRLSLLSNGLGLDDWTLILSLVFFTLLCAGAQFIAEVERRNPVISVPIANTILMVIMLVEVVFMLASIFLKISLSMFFLQFLREPWQRYTVIYSSAFYCLISFSSIFLLMFRCGLPVDMAVKDVSRRCVSRELFDILMYGHGTISVLSDWIYALLPILVLRKSKLPRTTKVTASALLSLAVAGSIAAIARTINTDNVAFRMAYYNPNHQPTFYRASSTEIELAIAEIGCGIIAASLACLRPLARRFISRWDNVVSKITGTTARGNDNGERTHPAIRLCSVEEVLNHDSATASNPKDMSAAVRQYSVELARIEGMTELGVLSTIDMDEMEGYAVVARNGLATDEIVHREHV